MKSLYKLFYIDAKVHKAEYEKRLHDDDTLQLGICINEFPAFVCQTSEIFKLIISIERTDKKIHQLCGELPNIAIEQFANRCIIDEILLTNHIEGVHSTRKEIGEILQDLSAQDKRNRFVGLINKYMALMKGEKLAFSSCQDIRKVYDDMFYEEIKATDPGDLPDGKIFRKDSVSVYSDADKEIHHGLFPESKIISTMEQALTILNNEDIDFLIRIAVFHYLFGYIHPFYDGNGRTSRFISSYLLSQELHHLIGFRLSYTIKENIRKYYEAFKICNHLNNRGELTPFVEMFLRIVDISMYQLFEALTERKIRLEYYSVLIPILPNARNQDISHLYDYLIQARLFSNIGISREELLHYMELSENTLRSRLKSIPENLLIQNRQKGKKFYMLDLDEVDKLLNR